MEPWTTGTLDSCGHRWLWAFTVAVCRPFHSNSLTLSTSRHPSRHSELKFLSKGIQLNPSNSNYQVIPYTNE